MASSSGVHTLLTALLTAGVLGAACGGSSKPAPTGPTPPGEGTATAIGTTGLAGLDWGATADAVVALDPRGTASEAGITAVGMGDPDRDHHPRV